MVSKATCPPANAVHTYALSHLCIIHTHAFMHNLMSWHRTQDQEMTAGGGSSPTTAAFFLSLMGIKKQPPLFNRQIRKWLTQLVVATTSITVGSRLQVRSRLEAGRWSRALPWISSNSSPHPRLLLLTDLTCTLEHTGILMSLLETAILSPSFEIGSTYVCFFFCFFHLHWHIPTWMESTILTLKLLHGK